MLDFASCVERYFAEIFMILVEDRIHVVNTHQHDTVRTS